MCTKLGNWKSIQSFLKKKKIPHGGGIGWDKNKTHPTARRFNNSSFCEWSTEMIQGSIRVSKHFKSSSDRYLSHHYNISWQRHARFNTSDEDNASLGSETHTQHITQISPKWHFSSTCPQWKQLFIARWVLRRVISPITWGLGANHRLHVVISD